MHYFSLCLWFCSLQASENEHHAWRLNPPGYTNPAIRTSTVSQDGLWYYFVYTVWRVIAPAQPAIEYTTRRFNGSLNFRSVYKGTPRKELDDAWHALSPGASTFSKYAHPKIPANCDTTVLPGPTLAISVEELKLIGKDSTADATVQIPAEFGGGYYATLEVFHQLHCLVRSAFRPRHITVMCCLPVTFAESRAYGNL